MDRCSVCHHPYLSSQLSSKEKMCQNCIKTRPSSNYKRCNYCMSDFKLSVAGTACLKCQELEKKFGPPLTCVICNLQSAFGNSTACQRCSHYQSKFGSPVPCQHCNRNTAFYKDADSRKKVDNAILCFLCTYNYKLKRARERQDSRSSRKRARNHPVVEETVHSLPPTQQQQQQQQRHSLNNNKTPQRGFNTVPTTNDNADSIPFASSNSGFADPTMTIQAMTEESTELRRKLEQKDRDLLAKTRELNEIRGDMEDLKDQHREKISQLQMQIETERNNFWNQLDKLRKENAALLRSGGKKQKKPAVDNPLTSSPS